MLYCFPILAHHSRKLGASMDMPSPTMATNRPPGARRFKPCSMWSAPIEVARLPGMRPAVALNGGFITTTVGFTVLGRMLSSCSAFSPNVSA
jgi:hypothetical protein